MANGMPESSVSTDSSVEPKRSINDGNNYSLETLENPFKKNPEDYSIRQNSFDQNFPVSLNTDSSDYNNILGGIYGPINVDNAVDVTIGGKMSVTGDITVNQIIYPNGTITQDSTNSNWSDVLSSCKSGDISYPNGITSQPVLHVTTTKPLGKGWMREWWTWMSCAVGGALLVLVTVVVISLTLPKNSANKKTLQPQYPFVIPDNVTVVDDNDKVLLSDGLHIIQRIDWMAHPPDGELAQMVHPIPYISIQHTETPSCFSIVKCGSRVLNIQEDHMENRNFNDIGYNFLIGGDGYVYVGRSWEYVGAHTYPYNYCSLGIGLIGDFSKNEPSENQMKALKYLIEAGVESEKLSKDYRLYSANTLKSTNSPGENVIKIIKNWPHWSTEQIKSKCFIQKKN